LEQNNASNENANSNQGGNKYVMAPRIRAALEKFNKKRRKSLKLFILVEKVLREKIK
jgi:hypothetical protein